MQHRPKCERRTEDVFGKSLPRKNGEIDVCSEGHATEGGKGMAAAAAATLPPSLPSIKADPNSVYRPLFTIEQSWENTSSRGGSKLLSANFCCEPSWGLIEHRLLISCFFPLWSGESSFQICFSLSSFLQPSPTIDIPFVTAPITLRFPHGRCSLG